MVSLTKSSAADDLPSDRLKAWWRELNTRYFSNRLPPIPIVWSRRLTSSVGMFASLGGPKTIYIAAPNGGRREIRLSLPLFERLAERTPYAEQELRNTLAHEMIHQWQFDVLKRRPNHGLDFLRKMTEINRSGEVAITTYHSLQKEVLALSRFAWRCIDCGRVYRRQRRTIEPGRHYCGVCRGRLQELFLGQQPSSHPPLIHPNSPLKERTAVSSSSVRVRSPEQLTLALE